MRGLFEPTVFRFAYMEYRNHHVLHVPYLLDGLSSGAGSDVRRMVRIDT